MIDPNNIPVGTTSPERRAAMIQDMVAAGHPRQQCSETVDLACHAVEEAVKALYRTTQLASHPGIKINVLMMALQMGAIEFKVQSEAATEFGRALATKYGMPVDTVINRPAEKKETE